MKPGLNPFLTGILLLGAALAANAQTYTWTPFVSGTLDLTGAEVAWTNAGTYTLGDKFTLFAYTTGNLTGEFAAYTDDTEYTFAGGLWLFDYDDTGAGDNGGTGSRFVTITAVPEPRAALIGGLGLLALLRRRRA